MSPPPDRMKVDTDDLESKASLATLPNEVLQQICDELSPNVGTFRLLNKRFAAIGRPYLAGRHYQLYLNPVSVAKLQVFAGDDEWQRRISEVTYRVDYRVDPRIPALTEPQYKSLEDAMDDNFTDDANKLARYNSYVDWRARQHDGLVQNSFDLQVLVSAIRSLPNLEKVNVEVFPCLDRLFFIPAIEQTFQQPIGFVELLSTIVGAKDCTSQNLKELCARKICQGAFGPATAPTWALYLDGPLNNLSFITKLVLLLDDEYCRSTRVDWSLENLPEILKLFPNLEDFEFGLDVCSCGTCLGDVMSPPDLERMDRFVDISTAGLANEDVHMRKLDRVRFCHTRWVGDELIQFIWKHSPTLRSLELDGFELIGADDMDLVTLIGNLNGFIGMSHLAPIDRPFRVYDVGSDPRQNMQYLLRRRDCKDYRILDNTIGLREQRGGVLGEDVVLDYW